jgi:hypothetical protein
MHVTEFCLLRDLVGTSRCYVRPGAQARATIASLNAMRTAQRAVLTLRSLLPLLIICLLTNVTLSAAENVSTNSYATVESIFHKHCLDCHASQDPEAKFIMETFEDLMKGGESGPALVAGKADSSLLVQMIEGRVERDGKKRIMPPGKRPKLDANDIAIIKSWIDAGAFGPAPGRTIAKQLVVPKITPRVEPRRSIYALAYAASPKLIAIGRHAEVELLSAETRLTVRTLAGHRGNVNDLVFSADGSQLFAVAGEAGVFGEIRQWNVSDGKLLRTIEGHRDAIYSVALSPDGKILATGSYDQKIKLWTVENGEELKTLAGHNGAIFDLAFRPDGKILASASADRTVKLWDVASGERRDTLSQSLKEVYAVAFASDGKRLVAGGVDNRIRVWAISETAAETTNPLLEARFAHEGAILKLVFSADGKSLLSSADDRTVKLWDAAAVRERQALESQPDWVPGLAFALEDKLAVVGRLDGSIQFYDATNGKVAPPPKPQLVRAEPRGIQRGTTEKIKLIGSNLVELTELKSHDSKLTGSLIESPKDDPNAAFISLTAAPDMPRGSYELSILGKRGESGRIKIHVDDLPQVYDSNDALARTVNLDALPVSFWATHQKIGKTEDLTIRAKAGQTLVFDAAARSLGSKSDLLLSLFDSEGAAIASSNGFDGGTDPLLVHTFATGGNYRIHVNELLLGASTDHFYRLSIGELSYVTGCFPLSVPLGSEGHVELIGYNLPPECHATISASSPGERTVELNPDKFRSRREFKVIVSDEAEFVEAEPNDEPAQAMRISIPGAVNGRIWSRENASDADLYRFQAKAGQSWIIEIFSAQRGTPLDSKIEILHADGKPVPRLLLQAVRNSAVTFRAIDSNSADCRVENWEEMELNQFLYLQGEVVKLFRAPQGPDSGFVFYTSNGRRRSYFDTSPTAHANEEPCYIVEPHPPGTKLVANGLPVFAIYYANDDDGERKLGSDSKIHFTAPADGDYLIRVSDTRSYSGDRFVYRLNVREPQPDFKVTLNGANPSVNAGSGQSFSVNVERLDGFEGEVHISKLPPAFSVSTPLIIQAGHSEAKGTINAALNAAQPTSENSTASTVTASARINGWRVTKQVNNFGRIKLMDKPKLFVALELGSSGSTASATAVAAGQSSQVAEAASAQSSATNPVADHPLEEMTIAPGQTVPAILKVKRNGHEELVTFTVDNLPHGVIVDNIGLNGVLIPKDQNERQIFLTAAKWVPDTDRFCFAVENQAGRQTSLPVVLHVRKQAR